VTKHLDLTWLVTWVYYRGAQMRLFELSEKLYICSLFLFLLQSIEILQNGTVVASVPCSSTFASRFKKNYYVTEACIANKFVFLDFYRLFVTCIIRYAAHT